MNDKQKLFHDRMEAEIATYRAELEKMEARARAAGAEAGLAVLDKLDGLERQLSEFDRRLQELKETAEEHRDQVREGISLAWDDFKRYFEKESPKSGKEESP